MTSQAKGKLGQIPGVAPAQAHAPLTEGQMSLAEVADALPTIRRQLEQISKADVGAAANQQAALILKHVDHLLKLTEPPKPLVPGNIHTFRRDIDLNGLVVVLAEFGQKSEIFPSVLQGVGPNTSYSAPMASDLIEAGRGIFASWQRGAIGRDTLQVTMRGLSFQATQSAEPEGRRRTETVPTRISQNAHFLSVLAADSIRQVSKDESSNSQSEEAIRGVAVAYVLGKPTQDNVTIARLVRESLHEMGGYDLIERSNNITTSLPGHYGDVKIMEGNPDLRLIRIVGLRY